MCAPPQATGDVDPVVLAACEITGASAVYRMGGAQAIAALAYGTESIAPVDIIVGPGNLYVQEAKRQVFGQVGIDGFAGPSDLLVIALRATRTPIPIALDLLAQAEHGPGTLVIAVSDAPEILEVFEQRIAASADTGAVTALVQTRDPEQALAVAEAFAPEHLQLVGRDAEALASRVTRRRLPVRGRRRRDRVRRLHRGLEPHPADRWRGPFRFRAQPRALPPALQPGARRGRRRAGRVGCAAGPGRGLRAARALDGGTHPGQ